MPVLRAHAGRSPVLGRDVFIADNATLVGEVQLGDEASVWYGAVLRGDVGRIVIGARTNIQDNATIHMTHQVSHALIGADVIVGHNAVIHGALIEDGALIGMSSVVLDNARVGAGSWVAAGSVVPPNLVVPPGMLVRGSPAKVVREVRAEEREWAREGVLRYLGLARQHRLEQLAEGESKP
ncbi:MAG TPA: gamma carbonic anhydrase family protein [Polyangiaceae bacterium]|nr:gamma carbonic anhydrase family protein [Polyangiaceae bacterium]